MMMMRPLLALLEPNGPQLLYVLGGIMGLLAIYVLILSAISKHKEVFGENPPITTELKDLRRELEKYAPRETVDKIVQQLGLYVTDERLKEVLRVLRVDEDKLRQDFHGDMEQLRTDVRHDVKEVLAAANFQQVDYADQFTEVREKIEHKFGEAIAASNSSASKTHARIDALATSTGEMRGELKQVDQNIARLLAKAMQGKSA